MKRRWLALALLAACGGPEPPMTTMAPKSDVAEGFRTLFLQIVGIDSLILVIVVVALFLGIFRYSKRSGIGTEVSRSTQLRLETAWTVGPALVLLMIAVPSVRMTFRLQPSTVSRDALVVRIIARQWWWEVRYPDLGVTTANEVHVPAGVPVRLLLESADVIHSFWVPQLAGKRDVVPGQTNEIILVPRVPGVYPGQCAEFCGLSHANMGLRMFVDRPEEFAAWRARAAGPAVVPAGGDATSGARLYAASTCTPCHALGAASAGRLGPDLTHFGSRTTLAGGLLRNTPDNVAAWLRDPQAIKPGARMPALALSEAQVRQLVAYLESLE